MNRSIVSTAYQPSPAQTYGDGIRVKENNDLWSSSAVYG